MRSVVGARSLSIVVGLGLLASLMTIAPVVSQQPAAPQRPPAAAPAPPAAMPVSRYAPPAAPAPAMPAAPQANAPRATATAPRAMSPLRGPGAASSPIPGFNTLRGSAAPAGAGLPPSNVAPNTRPPAAPMSPPGYPGSQRAGVASPYGGNGGVTSAVGPAPGGFSMPASGATNSSPDAQSSNRIRIGGAAEAGNSQLQIRSGPPAASPTMPAALPTMPGSATVIRPAGAPAESPLPGTPSQGFGPPPATSSTPAGPMPAGPTTAGPTTAGRTTAGRTTTGAGPRSPAGAVMISDDGSLSDIPPAGAPQATAVPPAAVLPASTPIAAPPTPPQTSAPPVIVPLDNGPLDAGPLPGVPAGIGPTTGPGGLASPDAAPASLPIPVSVPAGPASLAGPASVPTGPASLPAGPASLPTGPASLPAGPASVPAGLAPLPIDGGAPIAMPAQVAPPDAAGPAVTGTATMPRLEPVDFNGVLLGESTIDEVLAGWGEPRNRTTQDGVTRLSYVIEPFSDVEVTFFNGRATAVVIDLGETFVAEAVAKELGLEGMPTVAVDDPRGKPLGLVFPERGVAFRFTGDGQDRLVTQIGLDRIDARPFVLRAERRLRTEDQAALNDADTALSLDANNGRAHYVRAQVLRAAGRRREAMAAVEAALKLEPKSPEYLLARGQLLADEGMFDAAMEDTEAAIQAAAAAPHLQARAWSLRGDFLAGGPDRDYGQAIDAHTRAIRLAEPLLKDERVALRRAAREVLVEAHLGTAEDVAWGEWAQKDTVVPKWLARAEKLAADGVKTDAMPVDSLLAVYRRALTAAVGTQGKVDPKPWAEKLLRDADAALVECNDPLRRTRLQYEAGFGLYDALQAAHARGNVDEALRFGTAAVERIQPGRIGRDPSMIDGYRYGRLYFRVGSLYAVGRQDHATAVEWFERAAPLLERPLPEAAAADRGRQGETLVSMGISYWAVGKRDRALELTTLGARIMQDSVAAGTLDGPAMVVAYANLSTMHDQLGDADSGKRYAEMASRLEAPGGTLRR